MISVQGVQGILFDSGDTLMGPIGGEWLPGQAFRRIIADQENLALNWTRLDQVHQQAFTHLLEDHLLYTEEEECERFQRYFEWLLRGLEAHGPIESMARDIAHEMVHHPDIELFPDVISALERFASAGFKLGVISNGWPSLDRQLRLLGVRHFFDVLTISAHVGSRKPDARIFEVALEQMELPAGAVLLVDDALENIVAAERLGMQGVVVARNGAPPEGYSVVSSLAELEVMS